MVYLLQRVTDTVTYGVLPAFKTHTLLCSLKCLASVLLLVLQRMIELLFLGSGLYLSISAGIAKALQRSFCCFPNSSGFWIASVR